MLLAFVFSWIHPCFVARLGADLRVRKAGMDEEYVVDKRHVAATLLCSKMIRRLPQVLSQQLGWGPDLGRTVAGDLGLTVNMLKVNAARDGVARLGKAGDAGFW